MPPDRGTQRKTLLKKTSLSQKKNSRTGKPFCKERTGVRQRKREGGKGIGRDLRGIFIFRRGGLSSPPSMEKEEEGDPSSRKGREKGRGVTSLPKNSPVDWDCVEN